MCELLNKKVSENEWMFYGWKNQRGNLKKYVFSTVAVKKIELSQYDKILKSLKESNLIYLL